MLLLSVFDKIQFTDGIKRVLDITDKYSYGVYLVHQFLILGPISLMGLMLLLPLNILIILLGIMLMTGAVNIVEKFIIGRIKGE